MQDEAPPAAVTAAPAVAVGGMVDPAIFEALMERAEEDAHVHEELGGRIKTADRLVGCVQGRMAAIHATPLDGLPSLLPPMRASIDEALRAVEALARSTEGIPFYKYHGRWTRTMQNVAAVVLLYVWLGGTHVDGAASARGRLLTINELNTFIGVPFKHNTTDLFHLTTEEYLLALCDLVDEVSRLAINAVTLGDAATTPPLVSDFVRDIYAGFQLLNLRNDTLRRRVDGLKYSVKRVEDVIYDLSLRGMIPRPHAGEAAADQP